MITSDSKVEVSAEKLQAVRDGMWLVVNGGSGTARRAAIPGKDVAGKTGTAQVISLAARATARTTRDLRDHGWFTFFATRDNPEIAGVVFLSAATLLRVGIAGELIDHARSHIGRKRFISSRVATDHESEAP